jgi:DNA-binding MarR family transcriptional regulator
MDDGEASRLADLTADLMMVIGRMKGSAQSWDREAVHPGTEYAVLDTILRHSRKTVPEIAAWRGVARQSVQSVVNNLIKAGLVGQRDNPDHKSSKILTLEDKGQRQYELVRDLLRKRYREKDAKLRKGDLEAAARVMTVIASTWGLDVGDEKD